MPIKPENQFIHKVHKAFGPFPPHFEKMYNPLRGGTPDVYYCGDRGSLWIEYKFLKAVPKKRVWPNLSPLQLDWLMKREAEGIRCYVVIGTPTLAACSDHVYIERWNPGPSDFCHTPEGLAKWIKNLAGQERQLTLKERLDAWAERPKRSTGSRRHVSR
jgi:hypothetical protein